jgi:hypothetical protein
LLRVKGRIRIVDLSPIVTRVRIIVRSQWLHIAVILIFAMFILTAFVITVLGYLFRWEWTGVPEKTYWHWLELLIAPVLLSGGGFLLFKAWDWSDHRLTQQHAREAARHADLDSIAKTYLDEIEQLLLKVEGEGVQSKLARNIARTRTLNVLEGLDENRKGSIIRFLHDTGSLERGPHLFISLKGANLKGANLRRANLCKADLSEAILCGANLSKADLTNANLSKTDLTDADLTDATVADKQLEQAESLEGAIMPDGSKHL